MAWRWANKEPIRTLPGYRTGIRMRFLSADLEWLWENFKHPGRPDSVSPVTATRIFARDFFRRQTYDYVDRSDLAPTVVAIALHLDQVHRRMRVKYARNSIPSYKSDLDLLEGQYV
jgi:hypothetical protein